MTADPAPLPRPTARDRVPIAFLAVAVAAVATAVVVAGLALGDAIPTLRNDFAVFHLGGSSVLSGVSPYDVVTDDHYRFLYPPFAALVLAPLGLVGLDVGFALWTFASVLGLEVVVWLALGLAEPGSPTRRARFAVFATVAALPTTPVFYLLEFGQITVLLVLLAMVDLALRPGRWQGVAVGVAAGIKLTPLIFVAYFLLTRRVRAAALSAGAFAATVLVGFAVLPGPSARYWGDHFLDSGRMWPPEAAPYNQSLRGVLAHLPGAPWSWVVAAAVVGVAGLAVSAWAARRDKPAAGVLACAVTGLLISPVSWPQHWVWVVPGLALWLWWGRRRGPAHARGVGSAWLALVVSAALMFPTPIGLAAVAPPVAWIVLLSALQVLAGLAFLVVLAVVLRREDRAAGAGPQP
ncbi:glycosyltransferase 87 family protein [Saccharothrix australiensis]|uniref:Alpha-1,2-mannosyltransferase n=1 Tax=Saccharothrix australiensis TaxID=2072 RepID=A0A495W4W8_9PSEU|nr:glycosyltransferase 87 family protein [Saccharothrix australiensis]RKT56731.1 alpha-1,2-mannosyltransferase [Saccharothrix australiensis]